MITFEIEIPPLRQRRDDIPELAAYFLAVLGEKGTGPIGWNSPEGATHQVDLSPFLLPRPTISDEAMAELQRRPWFGNVRELRNAIEHAMILARGGAIAPSTFRRQ